MTYSKAIVASYEDFEDYFHSFAPDTAKSVVIGDLEDFKEFQRTATPESYPVLFVYTPDFTTFESGGNKNLFNTDFLVLQFVIEKNAANKRLALNTARDILHNIQKRLENDSGNGMFDFDKRIECEPRTNYSEDNLIGWLCSLKIGTGGVGADSDYR